MNEKQLDTFMVLSIPIALALSGFMFGESLQLQNYYYSAVAIIIAIGLLFGMQIAVTRILRRKFYENK